MHNQTYTDESTTNLLGFNLYTTEFEFKSKKNVTLYGEIGKGNYFSPNYDAGWGNAFDVKLNFVRILLLFQYPYPPRR